MLEQPLQDKLLALKAILGESGSLLVAFSGGVDSTLLLKCAVDVLGPENVVAATVVSETTMPQDMDSAMMTASELGVRHEILTMSDLENSEFVLNPSTRCYICKKTRFQKLIQLKDSLGLKSLAEGSNMDDEKDWRPGERALKEFNVSSPLREAGLYKSEIRQISKELGLPTWDKPSQACLATRIPFGTEITRTRLDMAREAEISLHCFGFSQLRVRTDGTTARIEVPEQEIGEVIKLRPDIVSRLKGIGFKYVSLDLEGFRSGSLNEVLHCG